MAEMMKAQVVKAPYQMEYTEVPIPQINDDEVLIKVRSAASAAPTGASIQANMRRISCR